MTNVAEDDNIYLADGLINLKTTIVSDSKIITTVEIGGKISSNKGVNFPNTRIDINVLTQKDICDIKWGIRNQVDFIGLSFVQNKNDVINTKKIINEEVSKLNCNTPNIISKIEKFDAVEDIDEIIEESDGIMVARGDLGIEIPYYEVPITQKKIIHKCNQKERPVIVATQTMLSMTEKETPTRSETSDVANAVYDGADAVMLSEETAVGVNPPNVVLTMAKIMVAAEKNFSLIDHSYIHRKGEIEKLTDNQLFSKSVSQMANLHNVDNIITFTSSGNSALSISKNLIDRSIIIYAVPNDENIARKLSLIKSVEVPVLQKIKMKEKLRKKTLKKLFERKKIKKDGKYLLSYGSKNNQGWSSNSIKILKNEVLDYYLK